MPSKVKTFQMSGLAVDLPDYAYPPNMWSRGINVEMNEGFAARARGFGRAFGDALFDPRWLINSTPPIGLRWAYGGDTQIAGTDGVTHNDLTPVGVDWDSTGEPQPWTGGIIQGQVVANNQTGSPVWWGGNLATPFAFLPDWPTGYRANSVRPFREFLIAMNIYDGSKQIPELLLWSDAAAPGFVPQSWTPGPQSLAGSTSAAFNPGGIVDGKTLRDQFFIYKSHTTFSLQLVGGAFVLSARPIFSTVGALGKHCIIEYRGRHIVMGDGDVVVHDGINTQSLVDRKIRNAIYQAVDGSNYQNVFAVLDKTHNEIWFCVPERGALLPTVAVIWSIDDDSFGFRDLVKPGGINHAAEGIVDIPEPGSTWATRTTTWSTDAARWNDFGIAPIEESLVLADPRLLFQVVDLVADFDGVPPFSQIERTGLDMGSPDVVKHATRVYPRVDGTSGMQLQIRMGGAMKPGGAVTWDAWRSFRIGDPNAVGVNATGRFLAIEMQSDTGGEWRMPGFDLEYSERGRW